MSDGGIDSVYVMTAFPNKFKYLYSMRYPDFEYRMLNKRLQFQNIFLITRKKLNEIYENDYWWVIVGGVLKKKNKTLNILMKDTNA